MTTTIGAGSTPTFSVFVSSSGQVQLDPAVNRIFVRFRGSSGTTRGSTSVALSTPTPAPAIEPPPLADGVFGSLTITGSSQVPGTFVPVDKVVGQGASLGGFKVIFNEINNDAFFNSWVLDVNIFDIAFSSGAFITFGKFGAGAEYTCESGIVGNYSNCSGASFDNDARTVRFSNVQLQASGFGTVITLNGTFSIKVSG